MITQERRALLERFGVHQLSESERLELADALYESVDDEAMPSAELWVELKQRVDAYRRNPHDVLTWEQVEAMLKAYK